MRSLMRKERASHILICLWIASCGTKEFHGSVRTVAPISKTTEIPQLPIATEDQYAASPVAPKAEMLLGKFPAALQIDEKLEFTLDTKGGMTSFELTDILKSQKDIFRQLTRPSKTESFQQGHPPRVVNEIFEQEARKGMVDILVVIDNSISMTEEQLNLSDKMNELVASLGKSDWQIGVITTTAFVENNTPKCVLSLIRADEADAATKFRNAILAGTAGSSVEQGILQSVVGLSCKENPWVRPTASVAVLIVSDEDNCSADGSGCPGSVAEKEQYLINYVENEMGREVGKNAGFYGIFSLPWDQCPSASNAGVQYTRLVNYKANGSINYGNICDRSYKSTLNRISDNIATLLTSQFELKMPPLVGSLKLSIKNPDGSERPLVDGDYTVADTVINFAPGKEPPDGAKLNAEYLIEGLPMFEQLMVQDEPAPETISVRSNGQLVPATEYRVSGRLIQFLGAPEAEANVTIDYRLNSPLQKNFQLARTPLSGSLKVSVSGRVTEDYSFNADTKLITFPTAPVDGAEISIDWTYREGPQLSYMLPLGEDANQFEIVDGNWSVPYEMRDGAFIIPPAVHRAGKVLTLRYQMPDASTRTFKMPHIPAPQTLRVVSGDPSCRLDQGLIVEGERLMASCGVRKKSDFVLAYRYYQMQSEFSLDGVRDPDKGQWQVMVDGQNTLDFSRKDSTIELNFIPSPTSVISVQYTFPEASSDAKKLETVRSVMQLK